MEVGDGKERDRFVCQILICDGPDMTAQSFQFTNKLRTGAIVLTQRHGKAACKGIDRLCDTDYADSQYSAQSSDEEEKEKWMARKVAKGGGTASTSDAVAVHRKRWPSSKVVLAR